MSRATTQIIVAARDWTSASVRNAGSAMGAETGTSMPGPVAARLANARTDYAPVEAVYAEAASPRLNAALQAVLHDHRHDPFAALELAYHDPDDAYEYVIFAAGIGSTPSFSWHDNLLGKAAPKRIRLRLYGATGGNDRAPEFLYVAARLKDAKRGEDHPFRMGSVILVDDREDLPCGSFGAWTLLPETTPKSINPVAPGGWGPGLLHTLRIGNQTAQTLRLGPTGTVDATHGERLAPGAARVLERLRTTDGLSVCAEAAIADPLTETLHCTWIS